MKLRLKGNSIRMRLTQGEVEQLVSDGVVLEKVEFGTGRLDFTYAVVADRQADAVLAEYASDRMTVLVPYRQARRWAETDQVGIEADPGALQITVEKDFACLKPRSGEDETDMFPNPESGSC